jgi:hypothetical protein
MNSQIFVGSRFTPRWLPIFIAAYGAILSGCRHTETVPDIPMTTVMQNIREYGHTGKLASAPKAENPAPVRHAPQLYDLDELYKAHIESILAREDFSGLEAEARDARLSQARVQGGGWKLYFFYEAVSLPPSGKQAANSDWQDHFVVIRKWIAASPGSAAAHIALANAFVNYAWAARGNGYANTVSNSDWRHFHERIGIAKAALLDAAKTEEKCPYWFEVMQMVALAEGWDKALARELFDSATAFAPNYYHFYREYANFLLPKWYGEAGEMQAFAEEVSSRLPAPDNSIIYFEIASLEACQCDERRDALEGMSWPRIKTGYENLKRLYGTSKLKSNRFAYMSYLAHDKPAARESFDQLGDDWEVTVWHSAADYQVTKKWAFGD